MIRLDPLPAIRHFEADSVYTIGYGGRSLKNLPLNAYGFPIWSGVHTPFGLTHAAGAYQFEPSTWMAYVILLGGSIIPDFLPATQDAVASLCFTHRMFADWAPYDARLARYISAQGGLAAFALGGANPNNW